MKLPRFGIRVYHNGDALPPEVEDLFASELAESRKALPPERVGQGSSGSTIVWPGGRRGWPVAATSPPPLLPPASTVSGAAADADIFGKPARNTCLAGA